MRNERGMALGFVLIIALLGAIAAYAILMLAISQARHSAFSQERPSARYAAEAGLVWARQRLWEDPTSCFPANPDLSVDADGDGTAETNVDIVASSCGATDRRTLTAQVVY